MIEATEGGQREGQEGGEHVRRCAVPSAVLGILLMSFRGKVVTRNISPVRTREDQGRVRGGSGEEYGRIRGRIRGDTYEGVRA